MEARRTVRPMRCFTPELAHSSALYNGGAVKQTNYVPFSSACHAFIHFTYCGSAFISTVLCVSPSSMVTYGTDESSAHTATVSVPIFVVNRIKELLSQVCEVIHL